MYDFANILFSGPCNLRCPYCIGHNQTLRRMPENLNRFPLAGLDAFIEDLRRHEVRQISFSGTNTDPQLYKHEAELLACLRQNIPQVKISLHSNGLLALKKGETFNLYDRACISFPSFRPEVYRAMTGVSHMLDLAAIVKAAEIPLKISTLLTEENIDEVPSLIYRCRELGIFRLVLRKQYGATRNWNLFPDRTPVRYFGGNPIYEFDGMEVTFWDFSASCVRCLNLFSDGSIGPEYQLAERKSA
ncbi:MAG: radical SAM protein [bacterium]|nr:radical SAM protein [bacterium]